MYPAAFTSAQATLRVYGAVGVVIFATASVVVGGEVLAHGAAPAGRALFNVTFMNDTLEVPGVSGEAPLRSTTDATIMIGTTNITQVTFSITYRDNTISPLFNPSVSATITGPSGAGGTTGSVPAAGTTLTVTVPNEMPDNTTVEAGSAEEAIATATGTGNNATLGMGEWTVSLTVGSPLGPRPGGSITYTIAVEVAYFAAAAVRV